MKKFFLIILVLGFKVSLFSQVFNKTYNFSPTTYKEGSYLLDLILDSNSFIVAGASHGHSPSMNSVRLLISELDYFGDTLWTKAIKFKQNSAPYAMSILGKINQNKFVFCGNCADSIYNVHSPGFSSYPCIYIFKKNGDSVFQKTYIDTLDARTFSAMTVTSDKHIMICGIKASSTLVTLPSGSIVSDSLFLYLSKIDTFGNIIWTKTYDPFKNRRAVNNIHNTINNIISGENGSIIISGSGHFSMDVGGVSYVSNFFIKLDSNGNIIWKKHYKRNDYITWNSSWITNGPSNTLYFATNMATQPITGGFYANSNILYGQLNSFGDTLWTKQFADIDSSIYFTELVKMEFKNNKLYILGKYYYGEYHPFMIIADSSGNIKSYRRYETTDTLMIWNDLYGMEIMENGNIVYVGRVVTDTADTLFPYYERSAFSWIIKTDSFGCTTPGCEQNDTMWTLSIEPNKLNKNIIDLVIFPNPTTESITIKSELRNYNVSIYNLNGKLIKKIKVNQTTKIDLSSEKSGTYLVKVTSNNIYRTYKIIKQ